MTIGGVFPGKRGRGSRALLRSRDVGHMTLGVLEGGHVLQVSQVRERSLITGWGCGLENGEIAGPKLVAPPPLHHPPSQARVKHFAPPPFQYG